MLSARMIGGANCYKEPHSAATAKKVLFFGQSFNFLTMKRDSNSQASQGSPQKQMRIPEISIPKIENMIDVGGRKLHCCVYGNGSPAVVLVSGFEAPQAYWNSVIFDSWGKADCR